MYPQSHRVRRLTLSRGFFIAGALVFAILVLQMITTVWGAAAANRNFDLAARDTYSYVGDLTAERVARYAEAGRDVTIGTATQLERARGEIELEDLAVDMYFRLEREPAVRAIYAAWVDGTYVAVSRDGTGYDMWTIRPGAEVPSVLTDLDSRFVPFATTVVTDEYDPRTRPWYLTGASARSVAWTEPFIRFGTTTAMVSAVDSVRVDGAVLAVVGSDLNLGLMGEVLDNLPLGDGAEAYVLSTQHSVIAVPESRSQSMEDWTSVAGHVPSASDLGVAVADVDTAHGEDVFTEKDGVILLDRGFPAEEGLDWVLHIRADESQLSQGLGGLNRTLGIITLFSVVVLLGALLLISRVWNPLRKMRRRAQTDELTGLSNRHELRRRGRTLAARASARGDTVLVSVVDLDNFKAMNDEYGHDVGDEVLVAVGTALRENSRGGDIAARTGGDEFVMVQVLRANDIPQLLADRVRAAIEHEIHTRVRGGEQVGVTLGYASATGQEIDLDALETLADESLIAGKASQKGLVYGR